MSSVSKMVMQKFYRKAEGRPEKLPWHREEPGRMLVDAVRARGGRGRALDLGCGGGVFSAWLAEQGMQVTALDMFPEAIEMARARAASRGVTVELVCTDLFAYEPAQPFDLVLDSGCLHSLVGGDLRAYKEKLVSWLAKEGELVLGHWGKRHALDWRPIGPRRRTPEFLQRLFAPELELVDKEVTDGEVPLPFGPIVRGVGYRFRRGRPSDA
jgi:SAM-dependent methyltransferase